MNGIEHQIKRGVDFAEYAEAVGVPTSQVIALHMQGDTLAMIYTPEALPDDDPDGVDTTAWIASLARDADRIVRAVRVPEPTPYSVHDVCAALVRGVDVAGELWRDGARGGADA